MEKKHGLSAGMVRLIQLTGSILALMALVYQIADEQIFFPLKEMSRHESLVKSLPSVEGESVPELLSHRLIRYDEDKGFVTKKMADIARGNTLYFFKTVEEICEKISADDFITCANSILGKQFYYHASDTVADAWAQRYSDCDLNSYLLMDAMARAGFQASIVYAPGHAFISFKDRNGNLHFWETTENNNTGGNADLTDAFYRKTLPNFYYQPQDTAFAEKMYPVLTTGKLPEKDGRKLASIMFFEWPDNPLTQDVFYHFRTPLTDTDADKLKSLLVTDISSSIKRITLARYYLQKGDTREAMTYISQIDDAICNDSCLELKAGSNIEHKIFLFLKKHLRQGVTVVMIKNTFAHIIIWFGALFLAALILPAICWLIARLKEKAK